MLKKLVITSGAFLILFLTFSYASMQEPHRLETYQTIHKSRNLEHGAEIYAEHCASCHGQYGRSDECFDSEGDEIACIGRVLKSPELLCGDNTFRMQVMAWEGSLEEYISSSIANNRPTSPMPSYAQDLGGPLSSRDIQNVTAYVLNFKSGSGFMGSSSQIPTWPITVFELPAGDPTNGKNLFTTTYGCAACHGDPEIKNSNIIGPWSGDFKNTTLRRGETIYTPADYFYESVLLPSAFISPTCANNKSCAGPPSSMPPNFGQRLTFKDMADIMAYLDIDSQETNQIEIYFPDIEFHLNPPQEKTGSEYVLNCW